MSERNHFYFRMFTEVEKGQFCGKRIFKDRLDCRKKSTSNGVSSNCMVQLPPVFLMTACFTFGFINAAVLTILLQKEYLLDVGVCRKWA